MKDRNHVEMTKILQRLKWPSNEVRYKLLIASFIIGYISFAIVINEPYPLIYALSSSKFPDQGSDSVSIQDMHASKKVYHIGEPITITATILNRSPNAIAYFKSFNCGYGSKISFFPENTVIRTPCRIAPLAEPSLLPKGESEIISTSNLFRGIDAGHVSATMIFRYCPASSTTNKSAAGACDLSLGSEETAFITEATTKFEITVPSNSVA